MKKYIAPTQIALSVCLPSGIMRRVTFSPLTAGGSIYYTSDPAIISALEHHYRFGTLFREDISEGGNIPGIEALADTPSGSLTDSDFSAGENAGGETEIKEITVTDLDSAKEYLCNHFGCSRTRLRFRNDVAMACRKYGIRFRGPDGDIV